MRPFTLRALLTAAVLLAVTSRPEIARASDGSAARLARQHLSAIVLLQHWSRAVYRTGLPPSGRHCEPSSTEWVNNGDGTYTRTVVTQDCTRVRTTYYIGERSGDYVQEVTLPDGGREQVLARVTERFNGAPATVHIEHDLPAGDRIEYDEELAQEPWYDASGQPTPRVNFFYGIRDQGRVRLADGQCFDFELRRTAADECKNLSNGQRLPEDACREWFTTDARGNDVPKPDRLSVRLGCADARGTLTLAIPAKAHLGGPDFSRPASGALTLNGHRMSVVLEPSAPGDAGPPRWQFWRTRGAGYQGDFELGTDFSGRGQVFRRAGRPRGERSQRRTARPLQFGVAWDAGGVGTIILPDGQTLPSGPFAGALAFASLEWSGLAVEFGPTPGL